MGFMDELKKLTQPYDDEDDFFEGADAAYRPQPKQQPAPTQAGQEQALFESSFAAGQGTPMTYAEAQPQPQPQPQGAPAEGSLFGNLGKPRREGRVNFAGREAQVILFSPRSFDEAGEIVNHIRSNRSVVMTLEGLPSDTARRLLDFISGIAYALGGRITPVSAKTYFVTPQNVDILGTQPDGPETGGQYL